MEMDWARLGRTFAAAREAAGLTQVEVADRIGVTRSPIQSIERGGARDKPFKKVTGTMRSYARLLGWTDDSPDRVLRGGELGLLHGEPTASVPEASVSEPGGLPLRIVDELSGEGALLDTAVIPLSPSSDMVIVLKGRPHASPSEIRAALEAWRRAQPHLREMSTGQDRPPAANGA